MADLNPNFQPPPDYARRELEVLERGGGCPFYGASLISTGHLVRFHGAPSNRCALITNAHSPCWIEVAENAAPDWPNCPRNPEFVARNIFENLFSDMSDVETVARRDDVRLLACTRDLARLIRIREKITGERKARREKEAVGE